MIRISDPIQRLGCCSSLKANARDLDFSDPTFERR